MRQSEKPVILLTGAVLAVACIFTLLPGCSSNDRDNPLDPGAGGTDPFGLQVSSTVQGVQVQWQKIAGAGVAGYRVYRSTDSTDPGIAVGSAGSAGRSCTDSTGYNGTTYWYRMAALDAAGKESALSNSATATVTGARLSVTPTVWSPGSDSANTVVTIRSDSTKCRFDYTLTCQAGWLTITESSWGSVRLHVLANETSSERTAHVAVLAASAERSPDTIAVVQGGTPIEAPRLCLSDTVWVAPTVGGLSSAFVVWNCGTTDSLDYAVDVDSAWVTIETFSDTTGKFFRIRTPRNMTGEYREATLTLIADGVPPPPPTVRVAQASMDWLPLGDGVECCPSAMTVLDGHLFVAGDFLSPGNHIAIWNGAMWSALGSGTDGAVLALAVFENRVRIGGFFDLAGGKTVNNVAYWYEPSGNWYGMSDGVNDGVRAMTVYDEQLIVGGDFTTASEVATSHIASYDGFPWKPLGSGVNGAVTALTEYDGKLMVGGSFLGAGTVSCPNVASWNGSIWSSLGPYGGRVNGSVEALTVYDGRLIAGGWFTSAGGVSASHIAAWNGSSWASVGCGLNGTVYALTVYQEFLIAGGIFTNAGGNPAASYVAAWDGTEWQSLGDGVDDFVMTLGVFNDRLIVGGFLGKAGDSSVNGVASFGE